MDDLDEVPNLVFSQPMSTAEDIARGILDCAADGTIERTIPQMSGFLATADYLLPRCGSSSSRSWRSARRGEGSVSAVATRHRLDPGRPL